ncbi:MAG: 2Fe-2S iron-sulfur cluster-binding protein [Pseudomonadota bacterium]|nr:2Fe-2S iron-sulfur cluster-binding protein [Pseudomonadota bacterium]
MAVVRVIGRDGSTQDLDVANGGQLMDALRDASTGVQGTCGGMMSCGTCHVYVDPSWADRLPPKSEDESAMLEAIGELVELKPTSRLSCQIAVDDDIEGLCVEIAPPV